MSRIKALLATRKTPGGKERANFYLPKVTLDRFRAICDDRQLEYSHVIEALLDDFVDHPPLAEAPQSHPPKLAGGGGGGEMIKKIVRRSTPVLALALLTGCPAHRAQVVNEPGASGTPYAPINEESRGGVVKYLNQGADFIIKGRREDAYKQMYDSCAGGRYKIDAEGPKAEGGLVQAVSPGVAIASDIEYWYIQYSCAK